MSKTEFKKKQKKKKAEYKQEALISVDQIRTEI